MKPNHLFAGAVLSAMGLMAPTDSLAFGFDLTVPNANSTPVAIDEDGTFEVAKRGRGRGRGRGGDRDRGDRDDRDDDRRGSKDDRRDKSDDRSSGRSRPRIPGGSGCDDAGDRAEHAACGGGAPTGGTSTGDTPAKNSGGHGGRPRIPGGSGCDDAQDVSEHPECRV